MVTPVADKRESVASEVMIYQLTIERVLRKVAMLSEEGRKDFLELISDLTRSKNEEEQKEIAKTMLEILMPELVGNLVMGPMCKTDGKFLAARAQWIGDKIRVLREKRDWTQTDLAEASGLPQSHISRLEAGKHSPSNVTLKKIAKALRISVHELDYEEHEQ